MRKKQGHSAVFYVMLILGVIGVIGFAFVVASAIGGM